MCADCSVCLCERCHFCTLLFVRALTLTDGETTWIMAEEREGEDREQWRWKEDGGGGGFVHRPGGRCVCVCRGIWCPGKKQPAVGVCLPVCISV